MKQIPTCFFFSKFGINLPAAITSNLTECKPLDVESKKNQHARGAEQGPQEQVTRGQEGNRSLRRIEREARLDRQPLRTNHLTPRQRRVPLLVLHKASRQKYLFRFVWLFLAALTLYPINQISAKLLIEKQIVFTNQNQLAAHNERLSKFSSIWCFSN